MSDKNGSFIIEGLAGQKKLKGAVRINGAKNAALKAMAASVLFDGPVELENIPDTDDIGKMAAVLRKLGASVERRGSEMTIDANGIGSTAVDPALGKSMRASIVLTGPLLARFGKATFPAPGGCVIGARPIDLFIEGYAKLGAESREDLLSYEMQAPKLYGAEIAFKKISVGATETLMMAAVLAHGTTVLTNCAMEPEISNVAEWLNACGAKISGHGTSKIIIEGSAGRLLVPKARYKAIPDRIEAGSYLLLGALCASDLDIADCRPDHLSAVIDLLKASGVPMKIGKDRISITGNASSGPFKAFDVTTREFPGFPTDLQAQTVAFLTQAEGNSRIEENIFEGRFKYAADLVKMGASIEEVDPHRIEVSGPTPLSALPRSEALNAHDIRAGFAIVMAALVAEGSSKIDNVILIDRGYEGLEKKLRGIGANIERVPSGLDIPTEKALS